MRRTRLRTAGLCVLLTGLGLRGGDSERALSDSTEWRLYDRNPDHVWNRLYRSFYGRAAADGREYGYDELDPLLWDNTKYHLSGESHDRALRVLDEFLQTHAERLIPDPLKRAILQRDLWAVFDWLPPLWIIAIPLCFGAVFVPTFLIQRTLKHDSKARALTFATLLAVLAAIPMPIAGTPVGLGLLAWTGLGKIFGKSAHR